MMREKIVFGPIFSRRLGSSLGINLLPEKGKLCNFDCIYCECGWNKDGLGDRHIPTASDLREALESKLKEEAGKGTVIDSITFSGDGEPTLNPDFARIVDITLELRDRYYPSAIVSVLSNATRVCRNEVFEALRKVDKAIMKIDAPTNELAGVINRPACHYDVREIVEDLKRFEGKFTLQTMFLCTDGFDSSDAQVLEPWLDIVRELRPEEIMAYTIDRETPQAGIRKISAEKMRSLLRPLEEEGFKIQIKG